MAAGAGADLWVEENSAAVLEIGFTGNVIDEFLPGIGIGEGWFLVECPRIAADADEGALSFGGDDGVFMVVENGEKLDGAVAGGGEPEYGFGAQEGGPFFIAGDAGEDELAAFVGMSLEGANGFELEGGIVGVEVGAKAIEVEFGIVWGNEAEGEGADFGRFGFVVDDGEEFIGAGDVGGFFAVEGLEGGHGGEEHIDAEIGAFELVFELGSQRGEFFIGDPFDGSEADLGAIAFEEGRDDFLRGGVF